MTVTRISGQQLLLAGRLADMPYSSASDLNQWPNTSKGRVEANLNKLLAVGFVGREKIGWMRDAQWRYYLTDAAVDRIIMETRDWQPSWPVGEIGRKIIRSYGPMLECLNDDVPQAWSPKTVRAPQVDAQEGRYPDEGDPWYLIRFARESYPLSFHWLPEGPVRGLINLVDPDDREFWVPVVWYGTHASQIALPDTLFELFEHLPTQPDPTTGAPASPPGIVIVAADTLAAARAAREIPPSIPRAIIYGARVTNRAGKLGRFGIVDIQPMLNPRRPVGKVLTGQL